MRLQSVGANVLECICESLQCNIGDIADYVPDVSVQANVNDAVKSSMPDFDYLKYIHDQQVYSPIGVKQ